MYKFFSKTSVIKFNKRSLGQNFLIDKNIIKKIINLVKNLIKKGNPSYGAIKMRKDENIRLYPSIKNAKIHINWSPKISFNKGLKSTISYYKNER